MRLHTVSTNNNICRKGQYQSILKWPKLVYRAQTKTLFKIVSREGSLPKRAHIEMDIYTKTWSKLHNISILLFVISIKVVMVTFNRDAIACEIKCILINVPFGVGVTQHERRRRRTPNVLPLKIFAHIFPYAAA